MDYKANFMRHEIKYLLTRQQKYKLLQVMQPYMAPDRYGRSAIRNIYFDTETYRLVRRSIEKPVYKEKLRVRSYGWAGPKDPVFVELKKKYDSVVYKRRIALPEGLAMDWLTDGKAPGFQSQVQGEIDFFCKHYETLQPVVFLSYEREAFYCRNDSDFRVTFDENILARRQELTLGGGIWGTPLLDRGVVLMEIKTSGGIPLWMTEFLSKQRLYVTSFSKYGTAYLEMILGYEDERVSDRDERRLLYA